MKTSCPQCFREYFVKEDELNKKKIIFSCYACHATWDVTPTQKPLSIHEQIPFSKTDKHEKENIKSEKKSILRNNFFFIFIVSITALGVIYMLLPEQKKQSPFLLENVQWYEDAQKIIHISGKIVNPTISSMPTSPLNIVIETPSANKKVEKALEWKYILDVPVLMPQEKINFKTSYKLPPCLQVGRVSIHSS